MSPESIITNFNQFVTTNIQPQLPVKSLGQFKLGISAFSLQPIVSCNANARMVYDGSRCAAEQTMFRLLHNSRLADTIWQALAKAISLSDRDLVNVDYSSFDTLAILGFAKQTKRGRALPLLLETLANHTGGQKKSHPKYQAQKTFYNHWKVESGYDQVSLVMAGLEKLVQLYSTQPRLVFDRGFVVKRLVQYLLEQDWTFYLRMKDQSFITYLTGTSVSKRCRVGDLGPGDYRVNWQGYQLRLIVGPTSRRHPQPWRILTNDFYHSATKIIGYYYHRFEIEETFRDLKSLLRLRSTRLRTWLSLKVVLVFMSIAISHAIIRVLCIMQHSSHQAIDWLWRPPRPGDKKAISLIRWWQESVGRARHRALMRFYESEGGDV